MSQVDPTKLKDPTWQFAFGAIAAVIGVVLLILDKQGSLVFFVLAAVWVITAAYRHSKIKAWLKERKAI